MPAENAPIRVLTESIGLIRLSPAAGDWLPSLTPWQAIDLGERLLAAAIAELERDREHVQAVRAHYAGRQS